MGNDINKLGQTLPATDVRDDPAPRVRAPQKPKTFNKPYFAPGVGFGIRPLYSLIPTDAQSLQRGLLASSVSAYFHGRPVIPGEAGAFEPGFTVGGGYQFGHLLTAEQLWGSEMAPNSDRPENCGPAIGYKGCSIDPNAPFLETSFRPTFHIWVGRGRGEETVGERAALTLFVDAAYRFTNYNGQPLPLTDIYGHGASQEAGVAHQFWWAAGAGVSIFGSKADMLIYGGVTASPAGIVKVDRIPNNSTGLPEEGGEFLQVTSPVSPFVNITVSGHNRREVRKETLKPDCPPIPAIVQQTVIKRTPTALGPNAYDCPDCDYSELETTMRQWANVLFSDYDVSHRAITHQTLDPTLKEALKETGWFDDYQIDTLSLRIDPQTPILDRTGNIIRTEPHVVLTVTVKETGDTIILRNLYTVQNGGSPDPLDVPTLIAWLNQYQKLLPLWKAKQQIDRFYNSVQIQFNRGLPSEKQFSVVQGLLLDSSGLEKFEAFLKEGRKDDKEALKPIFDFPVYRNDAPGETAYTDFEGLRNLMYDTAEAFATLIENEIPFYIHLTASRDGDDQSNQDLSKRRSVIPWWFTLILREKFNKDTAPVDYYATGEKPDFLTHKNQDPRKSDTIEAKQNRQARVIFAKKPSSDDEARATWNQRTISLPTTTEGETDLDEIMASFSSRIGFGLATHTVREPSDKQKCDPYMVLHRFVQTDGTADSHWNSGQSMAYLDEDCQCDPYPQERDSGKIIYNSKFQEIRRDYFDTRDKILFIENLTKDPRWSPDRINAGNVDAYNNIVTQLVTDLAWADNTLKILENLNQGLIDTPDEYVYLDTRTNTPIRAIDAFREVRRELEELKAKVTTYLSQDQKSLVPSTELDLWANRVTEEIKRIKPYISNVEIVGGNKNTYMRDPLLLKVKVENLRPNDRKVIQLKIGDFKTSFSIVGDADATKGDEIKFAVFKSGHANASKDDQALSAGKSASKIIGKQLIEVSMDGVIFTYPDPEKMKISVLSY